MERLCRAGADRGPRAFRRGGREREIMMISIALSLDSARSCTEREINDAAQRRGGATSRPRSTSTTSPCAGCSSTTGGSSAPRDGGAYRVGFPPRAVAFDLRIYDVDMPATVAAYQEYAAKSGDGESGRARRQEREPGRMSEFTVRPIGTVRSSAHREGRRELGLGRVADRAPARVPRRAARARGVLARAGRGVPARRALRARAPPRAPAARPGRHARARHLRAAGEGPAEPARHHRRADRRGRADGLRVRGLDAIDGTPILDLKPYFPEFDSAPGARCRSGWADS